MKYTVSAELIRLDIFLSREANISRSNVKNILDTEGATVNGSLKFKSGLELKKGDTAFIPASKKAVLKGKGEYLLTNVSDKFL